MRLIDADLLIEGRVENDPVVIAAKCAPTVYDLDEVMKHLEEENGEERGVPLRLPCKVGDCVYTILDEPLYSSYRMFGMNSCRKVIRQKIEWIHITAGRWYMSSVSCDENVDPRPITGEEYQKTWFLSEEEANKRYQEIRDGYKVGKTHTNCKYYHRSASGQPCCEFKFSAYLGEVCNKWEEKCDD